MGELRGKRRRRAPGFLPAACYGAAGANAGNANWSAFCVFLVLAIALTLVEILADTDG